MSFIASGAEPAEYGMMAVASSPDLELGEAGGDVCVGGYQHVACWAMGYGWISDDGGGEQPNLELGEARTWEGSVPWIWCVGFQL